MCIELFGILTEEFMLEECRPMGRLFYLLLAMVLLVTGAQA